MPFQTKPLFLAIFPLFSVRKIAWHIPSDAEWDALTSYVESQGGCTGCAGTRLKATSGWSIGNGSDDYGFSALPGGFGYSSIFNVVGYIGIWWSSTEHKSGIAYYRYMMSNFSGVFRYDDDIEPDLFSVRCMQD